MLFTPTLTSGGTYHVYLNWTSDPSRASNVPVTVTHAYGSTQLAVNERLSGQWRDLGVYTFAAGTTGSVRVATTGTAGHVIADAVKFVACAPEEIIQDSTDTTGVVKTGTWTSSTSMAGYFGIDYLHDGNTGKGTSSVRYTPSIATSGTYRVTLNWAAGFANRATNVPVMLTHATGSQGFTVNQQQDGFWVPLGDFAFSSGGTSSILIETTGTNGYVAADAVRLEAVTLPTAP